MMSDSIINIFNTYKNYYTSYDMIIFSNCSKKLQYLFFNCDFLKSYVTIDNNMIILDYNKDIFPTRNSLYRFIVNDISPELVEMFSYNYLDGLFLTDVERYTIIHSNIQADLSIYYGPGPSVNLIKFTIGSNSYLINYNVYNNLNFVYEFVIDTINKSVIVI